MRRLSLIGSGSSHQPSSNKPDVFKTLDEDEDSWSINGGAAVVKPQIERIGDNEEDWFSEAEQRFSEEDNSNHSSPRRRGSKKLSPRSSRHLSAQVLPNESISEFDEPSEFEASDEEGDKRKKSKPSKKKKNTAAAPKRSTSREPSCLQFDFTKPPNPSAPVETFLSEFEATEGEETDHDMRRRDRKKKSSKDDPRRKQRRSDRARRMEESVDCSESESDFDTTLRNRTASRKQSILGNLSDEENDDVGYSGVEDQAAFRKSSRRPQRTTSSTGKKSSSTKKSSGGGKPVESRSFKIKEKGNEKEKAGKPIMRLAPAKNDYESDASRRRPKPRRQVSPDQQKQQNDSDSGSDSDDRKRSAIPSQYQVKGHNHSNGGKKSPKREKRRQSMAAKRPEDVVNAIRRRYSVSSAVYNTDTETDDQSVMTDDSECSRRSHRRSLEVWREKEKFKQNADTTFDKIPSEQKSLNDRESMRQQILDQSRRGPVRSISRQRMREEERSESTRLLGQLLGEPDESSSDQEKTGGRVRRHSLEMGYGQDTVYGTIDQVDHPRRSNSYLPTGLNTVGRRGSQNGSAEAAGTMRNLMQTLEGTTKAIDLKKTKRKSEKPISPGKNQPGTTKESHCATSYDKSLDEILKARRLRGAKGRNKVAEKEETKKFNAMNLLTSGVLFK